MEEEGVYFSSGGQWDVKADPGLSRLDASDKNH